MLRCNGYFFKSFINLLFKLLLSSILIFKMRTSPPQFDLLVTYMQQHGDVSKPKSNARGRISTNNNWQQLTNLLNSVGGGCTRSTEKWKKVWSDLKNNTKKKAARLHRAANQTGGGPAVLTRLTDLEQRVLNITGVQVATGLAVEEAGVPQLGILPDEVIANNSCIQPYLFAEVADIDTPPTGATSSPPLPLFNSSQLLSEPGPCASGTSARLDTPTHGPCASGTSAQLDLPAHLEVLNRTLTTPHLSHMEVLNQPIITPHVSHVEVQIEDHGDLSPVVPPAAIRRNQPTPSRSGQTTPHRRPGRSNGTRASPRRPLRPTQTEQATQHFLQAEETWRRMRAEEQQNNVELQRTWQQIASRALDARAEEQQNNFELQRTWQQIASRALHALDRVIEKLA